MIELEDFYQDFTQSIIYDADSRGLLRSQAFFENVCDDLVAIGDLTSNYTAAEYSKRGMEVYGYDYDEERQILSLLAHHYFQDNSTQTLTKSSIDTKFNRLKTFFGKCVEGFYSDLEETSDAFSMAFHIYKLVSESKVSKIRLIILSDGKATRNLTELPSEQYQSIDLEFRVVDIDYLYKVFLSNCGDGNFEVDVSLPVLQVETKSDEYKSYLSIVPGRVLADIYDTYGQKLLEQNVRTFLQFRGQVNKGLRNTIQTAPEKFFAYNNGITATATDIEIDDSGIIKKMKNFQIVNGGQTISAIYASQKISKLDISNVAVQMKLSVVKDKNNQDDFVSKVSEYANTQNKVNKSDFFSNNPFHKEFKDYSKRIWVAAVGGSQRRTHWYYERVRGEYLNEQAYLTKAKKKQFQLENPKSQLIDKTFLAKSENVWMQKPEEVSKGAQYSFAKFADYVITKLEEDSLCITEAYFKDAVSRAIMFKACEKIVSKSAWYDGGFRAQIVAYSIALFSYLVSKHKKYFDFSKIWEEQKLPDSVHNALADISELVYDSITTPPEGQANITQWCKKQDCWSQVKDIRYGLNLPDVLYLEKEEQKYNRRQEKKDKKLETGIEMQSFAVQVSRNLWVKLYAYYKNDKFPQVTPLQADILKKMSIGGIRLPSEKQSRILYELYDRAIGEGLEI